MSISKKLLFIFILLFINTQVLFHSKAQNIDHNSNDMFAPSSLIQCNTPPEIYYGEELLLTCTYEQPITDISYTLLHDNLDDLTGTAYITEDIVTTTKVGKIKIRVLGHSENGELIEFIDLPINILPKRLTVENIDIENKIYDGTTQANYKVLPKLNGIINNDNVFISEAYPRFSDEYAGDKKIVIHDNFILSGPDSINYIVDNVPNTLSTIEKREVTITNIRISDKIYDGTTKAYFDSTPTIENIIEKDIPNVKLNIPTPYFESKDTGENLVKWDEFLISDDSNYILLQPNFIMAEITKATLYVKADNKKRKYGRDNPLLTYEITGFVKGEASDSLSDFIPPSISCDIPKLAPLGLHKNSIKVSSGNPSSNYIFEYINGSMNILEGDYAKNENYIFSKSTNGWYNKNNPLTIKPISSNSSGYNKISLTKNGPWLDYITVKNTKGNKITFYLYDSKRNIISSPISETIKIDNEKPILEFVYDNKTLKNKDNLKIRSKKSINITIKASDNISNIHSISYYLQDMNMKKTKKISSQKPNTKIKMKESFKGYIIVTATDNAGNYSDYRLFLDFDREIPNNELRLPEHETTIEHTPDKEVIIIEDKEPPLIYLSYNKNNHSNIYNTSRTATIEIRELNFLPSKVKIEIIKDEKKRLISPNFSTDNKIKFDENGNPYYSYKTQIIFNSDGVYKLNISCKDKSGNISPPIAPMQKDFTIDTITPELVIGNLENGHSYNGELNPFFFIEDINLDLDSFQYSVLGKKNNEIKVSGTLKPYKNGYMYYLNDIEHIQELDDFYILNVMISDLAGNMSSKKITFSVNRFGSYYTFDEYTQSLNYNFSNNVNDIVIIENNIDKLLEETITIKINKNGYIYLLQKDIDYTITHFGSKNNINQYVYVISKKLFDNGVYRIIVESEDNARNKNHNTILKGGQLIYSFDNIQPVIITKNLDNNIYFSKEYKANIFIRDNIKLSSIKIFLNGILINQWKENELNADNIYPIKINHSNKKQTFVIVATDAAGNTCNYTAELTITNNVIIWLINMDFSSLTKVTLLVILITCISLILIISIIYLKSIRK